MKVWHLMFFTAVWKDLDIVGADMQDANINARADENVYTTAGPEFKRPAIIVWALYGLKSYGSRQRDHFASILSQIGFTSSKADQDVWMRQLRNFAVSFFGNIFYVMLLIYSSSVIPRRMSWAS